MPFNCEASQFVDIPLDSVNFDSYSFYKHEYTKTSPGRCKRKCKHVKTCKHNKGQSDCEEILHNFEYIKNQALILKDQGQSMYPKALIWQEYEDENGKTHFHSYVSLNNQEGKSQFPWAMGWRKKSHSMNKYFWLILGLLKSKIS